MRRFIIASFVAAALLLLAPAGVYARGSAEARAALARSLPEAKFANIPLSDALDFLRDVTGANIMVDWKALESVNVGKDTQINISVKFVKLSKVLSLVLNEAAPGGVLTYYLDENIITITTVAAADKRLLTVVYYVDDILEMDAPFDPTINIANNFTSGGMGGGTGGQGGSGSNVGGGGSGGGLFGGGNSNSSSNANGANGANSKQDRAKALITLIEKLIRPEVWKDNGGTAAIEYYNGNLIVTAPRSVQEAIGGPVD